MNAQTPSTLRTAQTVLEFLPGSTNPRLVSVGFGDQKVCINDEPEALIPSLEVGGRTAPIHWKFSRAATHVTTKTVSFVYTSNTPKLRLNWEWRVPLSTGPIEHTIKIENLEASEVWLPLQDSFRADCRVDSARPVTHFYIEKGAGEPSSVGTHGVTMPTEYRWTGASSTYAHPAAHEAREIVPWFAVESVEGEKKRLVCRC